MTDSSRKDRWFALGLFAMGLTALVALVWWLPHRSTDATAESTKLAVKSGASIKLGAKLAELYGIKTEAAVGRTWQPRLLVFGRVVPNAFATSELRAPFAGTVRAGKGWPEMGHFAAMGRELAIIHARFSPQERLDVQSKAAEAQAKLKGAEEVVKIQTDRVQRLGTITGIVPGPELDQAKVQLAEAKASFAGAMAQAQLWQKVADNLDHQPIAVALSAPIDGEVTEIGVRPDTAVEAGAVILKIVDFRKVLIRIDVPLGQNAPPDELELAVPGDDATPPIAPRRARRLGPASGVDAMAQTAGYYYQLDSPAREGTWRPGLFVQAAIADPKGQPMDAVTIPASAILYHQGRALVYAELSPGRFERREIQLLGRDGANAYVSRGVRSGERVVSQHAQVLLSEEFRGDADDD